MPTHVLWLEDDMTSGTKEVTSDTHVHVARNCFDAQAMLHRESPKIEAAIIDIRVPQSKWEPTRKYVYPGMAFLEREPKLREIPVIVLSGALLESHVKRLQALKVEMKSKIGLVVRDEILRFADRVRQAQHEDVEASQDG